MVDILAQHYECALTVRFEHKPSQPQEEDYDSFLGYTKAVELWRKEDPIERTYIYMRFSLPFAPAPHTKLSGELFPGQSIEVEEVVYDTDKGTFELTGPIWFVWDEDTYHKQVWEYEKRGWESFTLAKSPQAENKGDPS